MSGLEARVRQTANPGVVDSQIPWGWFQVSVLPLQGAAQGKYLQSARRCSTMYQYTINMPIPVPITRGNMRDRGHSGMQWWLEGRGLRSSVRSRVNGPTRRAVWVL
jgi:hypothetical protein